MSYLSHLCPYVSEDYIGCIDKLLNRLDEEERNDKLQTIVYHIQEYPEISNILTPPELCGLNHAELSVYLKKEDEDKNLTSKLEDYNQRVSAMEEGSVDSTIKCKKCGHDQVEWYTKQTRSADEGSTVFCTCKKCKARWKM